MESFKTENISDGLCLVYIDGKALPKPYRYDELGELYAKYWTPIITGESKEETQK